MLRDNLAGLIEPMRAARELHPLALFTEQKKSSDDRPQDALKIHAPKARNLTLTENAASPFHAEPRHECRDDEWLYGRVAAARPANHQTEGHFVYFRSFVCARNWRHAQHGAQDNPRFWRFFPRALSGAVPSPRGSGSRNPGAKVAVALAGNPRQFMGARSRDLVCASACISRCRCSGGSTQH